MEEIEIGELAPTHGGSGASAPGSGEGGLGGGGLGAGFTALDVNAEAADGDDTINAVFARIDSESWDSDDDLIMSPVFKGTDTLAYVDDLESGEVPILYQKFWDPYEDVTVTLFSITPRLTHAEHEYASGMALVEQQSDPMVVVYDEVATEESAQLALEAIENLSELAQQRTNVPYGAY